MLSEYVDDFMLSLHKSAYSGINAVEKILRDPGFSSGTSQHRVLWWPKNWRVSMVSKAMHQVGKIEQVVLIVHYRGIMNDDKTIFTKHDLAKCSSIEVRRFNDIRKKSRKKIAQILEGYREQTINP